MSGCLGSETADGGEIDDGSMPGNVPPTATAGDDLVITLPTNRVTLSGSGADTDGTIVGYQWTAESGPKLALVRNADDEAGVAVGLVAGTYVFRLTVLDSSGGTASDEVTVTVNPDPKVPDTEVDHIRRQLAPVFRPGHVLPPLTFGMFPHVEFNKAIAEKYNFALHLGAPTAYYAAEATNWSGRVKEVAELNAADPIRYPLSIALTGYDGFYDCARQALIRQQYPNFAIQGTVGASGCYTFSPLGSAQAWTAFVNDSGLANDMATINNALDAHGAKISVMNASGEWGVMYATLGEACWDNPDPNACDNWYLYMLSENLWDDTNLAAAWGPLPSTANYGRAIIEKAYDGFSEGKGVAEGTISSMLVATFASTNPNVLYNFYQAGPAPHIGRFKEWGQVAWDHAKLRAHHVNHPDDIYNVQMYYGDNNEGGLGVKWGDRAGDHFTHALAAASVAIGAGSPHAQVWFSPQGDSLPGIVDPVEVMGFLKAYYALSMVGGPFFYHWLTYGETNPTTTGVVDMPVWMPGLIAMGEVHALFSHLDDFLYDGSVVANARGDLHPFRNWVTPFPLYEQYAYPVGAAFNGTANRDSNVRVVLRKKNGVDQWLLAGWAANTDHDVDVELPAPLGRMTLNFRRGGSVYRIAMTGVTPVATLVDLDPIHPTDHMLPADQP